MMAYIRNWRSPEALMLLNSVGMGLAMSVYQALLNNFAVERAAFTGVEIGILQSLREIPGFLAFTVVFVLLFLREQAVLTLSLILLGVGTAITGYFPSVMGLYITTVIGSIGFHYCETARQSLTLQWVEVERSAGFMGQTMSVLAGASLVAYGLTWFALDIVDMDMVTVYLLGGAATVVIGLVCWFAYPRFPQKVEQHKHLLMRSRYWLFYMLTFIAGARRQIFVVFAGFLMVEKFHFEAGTIALMLLFNGIVNMFFAPSIGRAITRFGERKALVAEYVGLVIVFVAYAFVESAWLAVVLFILDNLFFTAAIAIRSYFQRIADPADIASTSGVSFTINHIAAIFIPVGFGLLWMTSPAAVFLSGAAMAFGALVLALLVPGEPTPGEPTVLSRFRRRPLAGAAE
jgi:predicted MFS family arabinose efflux permease